MAVSRFSDYGVDGRYHNNCGCLVPSSLKQLSGILVDSVRAAAVNQQAALLIFKEVEKFYYFLLCCYLVLWLYTYYLSGPGQIRLAVATKAAPCNGVIIPQYLLGAGINSRLAVASKASLYDGVIIPEPDVKIHHIDHGPPSTADTHPVEVPPGAGTASTINTSIPVVGSDVPNGDFSRSNGNGGSNVGGIVASGSNGGSNNRGTAGDGEGSKDAADQTSFEGVVCLVLATMSGIITSVAELSEGTHKKIQNLLLICINIAAAVCFFSSFSGLLLVIIHIYGRESICGISLVMARKICLIIAVTFMMVTMIMVFVFVLWNLVD